MGSQTDPAVERASERRERKRGSRSVRRRCVSESTELPHDRGERSARPDEPDGAGGEEWREIAIERTLEPTHRRVATIEAGRVASGISRDAPASFPLGHLEVDEKIRKAPRRSSSARSHPILEFKEEPAGRRSEGDESRGVGERPDEARVGDDRPALVAKPGRFPESPAIFAKERTFEASQLASRPNVKVGTAQPVIRLAHGTPPELSRGRANEAALSRSRWALEDKDPAPSRCLPSHLRTPPLETARRDSMIPPGDSSGWLTYPRWPPTLSRASRWAFPPSESPPRASRSAR